MKFTLVTLALTSLFSVGALSANTALAREFHCPEKIETTQSIAKPVEGWAARVDEHRTQWFENFQVTSGPPAEMAILRPDGKKGKEFWTNNPEFGLWMSCYYRASTVTLEMALPKDIKKCWFKTRNKKDFLSCE